MGLNNNNHQIEALKDNCEKIDKEDLQSIYLTQFEKNPDDWQWPMSAQLLNLYVYIYMPKSMADSDIYKPAFAGLR